MNVVFTRRFEAELELHLRDGVEKYGVNVASETFKKVDRALRIVLANQPLLGRYYPARNHYRYVVARTPFVIYYQIRNETLVALAIRHGAQDRSDMEPD